MGDREQPVANRLIMQRWQTFLQQKHQQTIKNVKSNLDSAPPPQYSHLQTRSKKNQVAYDKNIEIEKNNLILLEKMRQIMTEPQVTNKQQQQFY
jgi:hypothetical protein